MVRPMPSDAGCVCVCVGGLGCIVVGRLDQKPVFWFFLSVRSCAHVQKEAWKHRLCLQRISQIAYPLNLSLKGTVASASPFEISLKYYRTELMFSAQKLQSNVQNGKWLTMINSLRISKPDVPSRSISINYCKPGLALQTMIQIKLMITSQTYELSKCQHNLSYFNKPVQPWTLDPSQPATPLRMLVVFKWKVDIMCLCVYEDIISMFVLSVPAQRWEPAQRCVFSDFYQPVCH